MQTAVVSIRRNGPLTVAGVLCASVALSLVGAALIVGQGVGNATIRWRGGVETIVFLEPTASAALTSDVGAELRKDPAVGRARFISQSSALAEFKVMFRNSPDMLASVRQSDLPASWRVIPRHGASEAEIAAIGKRFAGRRGIFQVVYARDAVASVLKVSHVVRGGLLALACALGAAAWLLVWTTCRTGVWARRDEVAVMKLVGAPRVLIRAPFVLEGAVQGLAGAAVAAVAVWTVTGLVQTNVVDGNSLAILRNFSVPQSDVFRTCLLLLVAGAIGGASAALLAVGRYVRGGAGADRVPRRRLGRLLSR